MRIGILADIHANAIALQAVLQKAESKGVEQLLIAGDVVGYYFEPLKVLQLLESWPVFFIRGNHEDYLAMARKERTSLEEYSGRYGPGIAIALEQLSDDQLDFLTNLPHPLQVTIGSSNLLLCHGAPWDVNHYVYPDASSDVFEKLTINKSDYVILGHTHYPMEQMIGKTVVINPGSVGQPRNSQPGAHWVLLDTESGERQFYCEKYDPGELIKACQKLSPELPYLAEVLTRQ